MADILTALDEETPVEYEYSKIDEIYGSAPSINTAKGTRALTEEEREAWDAIAATGDRLT